MRTTSAEARDILYERVADLRGALQQHGVRIEQFEVTADLEREAADAPAGDGTLLEGERGATDGPHQDRSEGRTEESSHSEGMGTRTERESHWEVVEESRLDVRV